MNRISFLLCSSLLLGMWGCNNPKQKTTESTGMTPQWIPLFNGKNLDGWTVKIRNYPTGENYGNTFRVEDGILKVVYDPQYYPAFEDRFGHLYTNQIYSDYKLRLEYRFVGDQVKGGADWAYRNSGAMLHSQDPESMALTQDFPVSVEAQFLGGNGTDERTTGNVCTPGTDIYLYGESYPSHCANSTSKTYHGDQWVNMEIVVYHDSIVHHIVEGDTVMTYTHLTANGKGVYPEVSIPPGALKSGRIALQSESHPVEFRKIEWMDLSVPKK